MQISPKSPSVGRKKINFDHMPARFEAGTFEQIDSVLADDENRTDFLRTAVKNEIRQRQKSKAKLARLSQADGAE